MFCLRVLACSSSWFPPVVKLLCYLQLQSHMPRILTLAQWRVSLEFGSHSPQIEPHHASLAGHVFTCKVLAAGTLCVLTPPPPPPPNTTKAGSDEMAFLVLSRNVSETWLQCQVFCLESTHSVSPSSSMLVVLGSLSQSVHVSCFYPGRDQGTATASRQLGHKRRLRVDILGSGF